jgi:polyisoprenoid-binding protein YceI
MMNPYLRPALTALLACLLPLMAASCDLFDPPPSKQQVDLATDDIAAGIASLSQPISDALLNKATSAATADNTMSVTFPANHPTTQAGTWTYVFSNYQGTTYRLQGSLSYNKTSISDYAINGTVNCSGGTVTSITYNNVLNTATTSSGTITINGKFSYDAETGQRVY